jgi:hypothetical protein
MHHHTPALGMALAGQGLDQLALAVARYAGDADDLAGADLQRQLLDRELADVSATLSFSICSTACPAASAALDGAARLAAADHHLGHGVVVERRRRAACRPACRGAAP